MLKTLKNFFFDDEEEVVSPSPLQNVAGRVIEEDFRKRLRAEIIIDYVDQDMLFHDFLQPSVLIQFQKYHHQAIFYVNPIDKRLRFEVMNQLNQIYGKKDIEIEQIKSRLSDTWGVRLHSDEYATRASTWDKSPCHDKMTRIVTHVRNGGFIERPNIKRPEVVAELQTCQESAVSRENAASNEIAESLRESLLKHRCGKRRESGGNGESGGFHPI
ncbi:hypothetical protein [Solidesulfovibrio carbinolicus]|uniref:hypothetical protein n=1 Tax=Solidesulfovibrio carbinolicus TaxID=296842 RepID=UPI0010122CD9|nr:hypothetical protein [Solidesulfovibrio carbinolicus]